MKFEITKPTFEQLPELYDMLWRSYEYHFKHSPRDYFKPYVEKNPTYNNENFFIITHNKKIVSSIQVFLWDTYFNNKKVLLGGIGQVATLPQFRGNGLAGKLLKETIKYMKKNGVSYSLLFAGPVPLYEKYGWKELPINSYISEVNPQATANIKTDGFSVKKYSLKYRYDVMAIHDKFIRAYNNCIVRNPVFWDTYFSQFKAKDFDIFVLIDKTKKCSAYVAVKKEKKSLSIYEYGAIDIKIKDYFNVLLKFLIKKYKPAEIYIPYGNKNYIPAVILSKLFKTNVEKCTGFMVRNINQNIVWGKAVDKTLFFIGDSF